MAKGTSEGVKERRDGIFAAETITHPNTNMYLVDLLAHVLT